MTFKNLFPGGQVLQFEQLDGTVGGKRLRHDCRTYQQV